MFRDLEPRTMVRARSDAEATQTPESWTTVRLAQVGMLFKGRGGSREDDVVDGVACIRYGDLYKHDNPRFDRVRTRVAPGRVGAYTKIVRGDIVFALSGESLEDIGKSAVCLVDEATVCAGDSAVLRPHSQLNPEFAAYVLDSPTVRAQKTRHGRGDIIVHISVGALKQLTFDVPSLDEQAAIVKYLRHAHARIDRAIEAKRKLIALLEEQKQAIINRGVTRGLDPTVPMKDSGIPWLGSVPAHWQVAELKRMLTSLIDCEHKTAPFLEGGEFHVVRTTAVRHGALNWAGTYPTSYSAYLEWTQRATPSAGDVIFTREAPAGEACVVPEGRAVCLGQRTVLMKVDRDLYDPGFLVHQISAGGPREQIRIATQGSTVGHLNMDDIGWMRVPVPPLLEQQLIVERLAVRTARINDVVDRGRVELGLLREFRTRLTSDVVTGQVDVRAIVAALPDFVQSVAVDADGDEDESLDGLGEVLEEVDA